MREACTFVRFQAHAEAVNNRFDLVAAAMRQLDQKLEASNRETAAVLRQLLARDGDEGHHSLSDYPIVTAEPAESTPTATPPGSSSSTPKRYRRAHPGDYKLANRSTSDSRLLGRRGSGSVAELRKFFARDGGSSRASATPVSSPAATPAAAPTAAIAEGFEQSGRLFMHAHVADESGGLKATVPSRSTEPPKK